MALRLQIENETNLPDGGPVTFTVAGKRTIDIGRDQHLDWTLPDPSRFISGKHCEVRYKDGGYWLHDVSTNGTYLNGAEERMRAAHRLKSGDRFIVGQYIIVAAFDADGAESDRALPAGTAAVNALHGELWEPADAVPPPIDSKLLRTPQEVARPASADFLDWAASVPRAEPVKSSKPSAFNSQTSDQTPPVENAWAAENAWATDPAPSGAYSAPSVAPSPAPPAPSAPPQGMLVLPNSSAGSPVYPAVLSASSAQRAAWTDPEEVAGTVQNSPFLRANSPRPPVAPQKAATATPDDPQTDNVFLPLFATAAGLPADAFAKSDHREVAQQLGIAFRTVVEGAMQLLKARNQAKQLTRSTSHTTIEATGNNPLKFSPTPEDAMRIMFGQKSRSYLDAQSAFAQTFDDLKSHQFKTYAALQHAVSRLVNELDPALIARDFDKRKAGTLLTSKKATLWDDYRTRWEAHMLPQNGGPIAAFMLHFADYYDGTSEPGA